MIRTSVHASLAKIDVALPYLNCAGRTFSSGNTIGTGGAIEPARSGVLRWAMTRAMNSMTRSALAAAVLALSSSAGAGDIATETTQQVTGTITAAIAWINDAISTATDVIQDMEQIAAAIEQFDDWDWEDLLAQTEFYDIFQDLEEVVRRGQALGHTVENVEAFMTERFKTYEDYSRIIAEQGEIDEPTVLARTQSWNESHLDTIRNTMQAHGMHLQTIDASAERLEHLQQESRSAEGRMQALQVASEIAGEEIQQLNALKEIIMEQSNLHASYFATKAAMEADAEAQSSWMRRDLMPTVVGDEIGTPVVRQ